jgi:hypothetical protein
MENPSREMRFARDQLIKTMNHPLFDTSPDVHQQEFLRVMAGRLQLDDDAMNALIRQTWNKRGPTPVLRPAPIIQSPQPIQAVSSPIQTSQPIQVRINTIFNGVDIQDRSTPAEMLRFLLTTHQEQGLPFEVINAYLLNVAKTEPRQHRLFVPQAYRAPSKLAFIYYISPHTRLLNDDRLAELELPSLEFDPQVQTRLLREVPSQVEDLKTVIAFIQRLKYNREIRANPVTQVALQRIWEQANRYQATVVQTGQFDQMEYINDMRGWRYQLTILSKLLKTNNLPKGPELVSPQPVATVQQPVPLQAPRMPGNLLPGIQITQPPIFTPNRTPPTTMYSDQPLSPTATRKTTFQPTNFSPSNPFLQNPVSTSPTFVNRTQQVYLTPNSKEHAELLKLRTAAEQLLAEEQKQPRNVQPLYRAELESLAGRIRVYVASRQQYGIDLYDYIREFQTFTDQLKDLQAKIAARPIPRYLPELDPEILYRPAALNQPNMIISAGDLRYLERMLEVLTEIGDDEVRRFGRDGVFFEDVDMLLRDLQDQIRHYTRQRKAVSTVEYLGILRNWRESIQNLIDARKALGRRCINDTDPWDMTPIVEIPDNAYIRLSNGMCWQIQSLMEYIRGVNGENTSKGLQGYASAKLWEDDADAKRILEHPLVTADKDFRQYFMNVLYGGNANKVSNQTLEMMYRTASLFVSRGKPFDEAIQKALTPQQYQIFMKYARGSAYETSKIPSDQQREEIETAIALILKSDATHDFWEYYDRLSQEEKAAIASFREDFERSLRECRFGKGNKGDKKLCVYVMANIILPVVYRIADIKGIPVERLNTKEH